MDASERGIENAIAEVSPVIDAILRGYTGANAALTPADADDVRSAVHLRLLRKLRDVAGTGGDAIENLRGYVATLTHNAVNDHLRKRFPERTNLKARLRYALTHDPRFALWTVDTGSACGFAEWRERTDVTEELPPAAVSAIAPHREDAPAALDHLFRAAGRPLLLDAVVTAVAEAWQVLDRAPVSLVQLEETPARDRADDIEAVRELWSEILELRPMQRKALLLNLRYAGETNVISLLILSGIARLDEIAAALEMTRAELAAIWKSLPLDDATIAERLGITRPQVANLRKAARARLWRRVHR